MRLSIAVSEARMGDAPMLLRWVRTAAACWVEADEEGALYVAVFEDFPKSVEAVVQLLSEVDDLSGVRIVLDGRPVEDLANFSRGLLCYWQSLRADGEEGDDCRQRLMTVKGVGACPDRSCASPCWLVCSGCLALSCDQRDQTAKPTPTPLAELARRSEVAWCPNLRL